MKEISENSLLERLLLKNCHKIAIPFSFDGLLRNRFIINRDSSVLVQVVTVDIFFSLHAVFIKAFMIEES